MSVLRLPGSIAFKLRWTAGPAIASVVLLAAVAVHFADRTRTAAAILAAGGIAGSAVAAKLELLVQQHRNVVESAPAQPGGARVAQAWSRLRGLNRNLVAEARMDGVSSETASATERLAAQLGHELPQLFREADAVLDEARGGDPEGMDVAGHAYAEVANRMQDGIAAWREQRGRILDAQVEELQRSASQMTSRVFTCAAVALALLLLAALIGAGVLRRLGRVREAVLRLAADDTCSVIPCTGCSDEIGAVAGAVETFRQNAIRVAEQELELRQANLRFGTALANMSQGLCLYDADGRLLVANERFSRIYGLDPGTVRPGVHFRDVVQASVDKGNCPGRSVDGILAEWEAAHATGEVRTVLQEIRGGRTVAISHCPMEDGGWVATYEDVTARRAAEARVTFLARHDVLTGLANRAVFRERLEQAVAEAGRGQRSAVLCLDLDHFKAVNDTLGHPVGDALLCQVAGRLRDAAREVDMVARLGGDEFAVVQAALERPEDARQLAERIVALLSAPFEVEGHQIVVGASVGVAMVPGDGAYPDKLLKCADMALYRAKADGRGRICFFEPGMDARLQARRKMELDLRAALVREEFELFFQPLVDISRGEVSGFEALLRWHHPERGLVSPADFIPLLEEIGLIVPVGDWVIRRACAEAATWPGGVKVAVNLSPVQFRTAGLVDTVADALASSGLEARRLELEITESVLLRDNDATLAVLRGFHALGVRISMDDFGTGYSSLSYLRSFPFDKVKIDQTFVRDLSQREDSIHVVRAVTGLCAGLGMSTTAEGVETAEQLGKLREEGCTEVQGFLFSPPKPGSHVAGIIAAVRQAACLAPPACAAVA